MARTDNSFGLIRWLIGTVLVIVGLGAGLSYQAMGRADHACAEADAVGRRLEQHLAAAAERDKYLAQTLDEIQRDVRWLRNGRSSDK